MYQTSPTYFARPVFSGLEDLTNSYSPSSSINGNLAYAAAASNSSEYVLSIPTSFSTATNFFYSSAIPLTYQQHQAQYLLFPTQQEYHFIPDNFLKPGRQGTFVGQAEEIRPFVEEAFQKLFSQSFPEDIKISVLDEKAFRKLVPSPGTIGLSINRRQHGLLSEIFILHDYLARVLLTIGHELGHVLTPTLENPHDEEAKAYAFSLVWLQIIKQHNIANLKDAFITENPAENGLHNVAFAFVERLIKQGTTAELLYQQLTQGLLTMTTPLTAIVH